MFEVNDDDREGFIPALFIMWALLISAIIIVLQLFYAYQDAIFIMIKKFI